MVWLLGDLEPAEVLRIALSGVACLAVSLAFFMVVLMPWKE